jgi:branched-subunit amino acid transport protein
MQTDLILACLAMTAVTYLCRALFTVSVSKVRISPWWEHYLTFIPFAVLTALVTPYLLLPGPAMKLSLINPYSLAGAVTFMVSCRTRNLILSVGVGMGLFIVLGKVLG